MWRHYLGAHGDSRLIDLLSYRFPLAMMGPRLCCKEVTNHSSARVYPEGVVTYLQKETEKGAILGPFGHLPSKYINISPLMSRPKDRAGRPNIVDLSIGDNSVNNITPRGVYDGSNFELTVPSLDNLIFDIIYCKGKPKVCEVDIQNTFRNLRVDPGDPLALGIIHCGDYYIDKWLAFGAVNVTAIFQHISDAICKILCNEGIVAWN